MVQEGKDEGSMASPQSSFVVVTGASSKEVGSHDVCCAVTGCTREELLRDKEECSWKIKTKYYTSETAVKVLALEALPHLSTAPQALVAVFDINEEETFAKVKEALETSVFSQPWFEEVEVRLMLANQTTAESSLESLSEEEEQTHWLSQCYNWCRDQSFEYVQVSTEEEQIDKKLTLFEDTQGMARVIEVLHCHRWPGSVLAQQTSERENNNHSSTDVNEVEVVGSTAAAAAEVMEDFSTGNGDGNDDGKADLENFERLLAQVSSVRQESEKLPDDQRRKVAEKMLFSIMGKLGIDEDE